MLKALNQDGVSYVLAQCTREEIQQFKQSQEFYCPSCKEPVMMKVGTKVIPHYAHKPNATCVTHDAGEGVYHENGKWQLYQWLLRQGYEVEVEHYLPSIQQRADIFVTIRNKQIAIEYQCCRISPEMMIARTEGYRSAGITPLWILGGNRLNRHQTNIVSLTSYDKLFFHQFHSEDFPLLFFYCSTSQQFARFQAPKALSGTRMTGGLSFLSPWACTLPSLLTSKQNVNSSAFYNIWIREKKRLRQQIPNRIKDTPLFSWRQWLYLRQLHPSVLPSLIHIPLPSQFVYDLPPYQWQAKLLMDDIHPIPTGGVFPVPKFPFEHPHSIIPPLVKGRLDPIQEYIDVLEKLGYVKQEKEGYVKKLRPIPIPKTSQEGLLHDHWVLKELMNL